MNILYKVLMMVIQAAHNLSIMYNNGDGVEKDLKKIT